jgi:hypothetical protein
MVEVAAAQTLGREGAHAADNAENERGNGVGPQACAADGGQGFGAKFGYHPLVDKLHGDKRKHPQYDGERHTQDFLQSGPGGFDIL